VHPAYSNSLHNLLNINLYSKLTNAGDIGVEGARNGIYLWNRHSYQECRFGLEGKLTSDLEMSLSLYSTARNISMLLRSVGWRGL